MEAYSMINGPRIVIRLVGGPAHDFLMYVPLERVPPLVPLVRVTGGSYYPDAGEADMVRVTRTRGHHQLAELRLEFW